MLSLYLRFQSLCAIADDTSPYCAPPGHAKCRTLSIVRRDVLVGLMGELGRYTFISGFGVLLSVSSYGLLARSEQILKSIKVVVLFQASVLRRMGVRTVVARFRPLVSRVRRPVVGL